MKKLMFVAAVALAGVAFAEGEIVSANVVGYQTKETADTYFSGGPTFTIIGSEGTYKLKDFKAEGMDLTSDFIQFLATDTAAPYILAVYAGEEYGELQGWWDYNAPGENPLDEQEFANGTAFLAAFGSGNTIKVTYAGQVATGSDTVIVVPAGTTFPFICNPTPVDLTLGQIKAEGMDLTSDFFQFLATDSAAPYILAVYAGEEYGELQGWWDYNAPGENSLDDQALSAGAAMLGAIGSGNEIVVTFPDPLATK